MAKNARCQEEHNEQVRFVAWFRKTYPDVLIFAVPNGATLASGPTQWNWLKSEGATSGVPDLLIPAWRIAIEMKRKDGGIVSDAQSQMIDYFNQVGWDAQVCNGFDSAKRFILTFVKRMPAGA